MKKLTLLSVIALSLLSACKKDESTAKIEYIVSAKKDNAVWIAPDPYTGFVNPDKKDSVLIIAHVGEETLGIKFKSKGVGTYQAAEINAYYWNTIGQDVIIARYKLSADASNSLIITSYNESKNIMTGTFNLTLEKTYDYVNALPTKLVFANGNLTAYAQSPSVRID